MSTSLSATPIQRDVVIITGDDASEYLQSQLSQDVSSIPRGRSQWSFILTPKSEIEAMVRVTRMLDGFILDVAPGHGDRVLQRLDGPLFRMDIAFNQETWPGIAWRGEGSHDVGGDAPIIARLPWDRVDAVDEIGPDVLEPAGVDALSPGDLDAIRIGARWPSEEDIDKGTTPAMTGIVPHTVSFDKGCYTGQEFVARVHYRDAAPPRRLVLVTFAKGARVQASTIEHDGEDAGALMSIAESHGVALGYCKRSVPDGADVIAGSIPAMIS
jgi:folate-binding protein YgfZ